jgi:hypothetical protein
MTLLKVLISRYSRRERSGCVLLRSEVRDRNRWWCCLPPPAGAVAVVLFVVFEEAVVAVEERLDLEERMDSARFLVCSGEVSREWSGEMKRMGHERDVEWVRVSLLGVDEVTTAKRRTSGLRRHLFFATYSDG